MSLLLTVLHLGFSFLQIGRLFRAQGAVLNAVGDAILLPGFAAVDLIHPGWPGSTTPAPAPEVDVVVVWAKADPVHIRPPIARIKSEFEILLIISVKTPSEESSSLAFHSASYERAGRLVTGEKQPSF